MPSERAFLLGLIALLLIAAVVFALTTNPYGAVGPLLGASILFAILRRRGHAPAGIDFSGARFSEGPAVVMRNGSISSAQPPLRPFAQGKPGTLVTDRDLLARLDRIVSLGACGSAKFTGNTIGGVAIPDVELRDGKVYYL